MKVPQSKEELSFPGADPLDEITPSNIRLKRRQWAELQSVAESEGKSRNEVIAYFLDWAHGHYQHAKKAKR